MYIDTLCIFSVLPEVITTFIILTVVWSGMYLIGYNYPVILIYIYFHCELRYPPPLLPYFNRYIHLNLCDVFWWDGNLW